MFPFSTISMGLLFIVVGPFLVVAVLAYVLLLCAVFGALINLGRWLLFGKYRRHESQRLSKSSLQQQNVEAQATNTALWDPWIDGVW